MSSIVVIDPSEDVIQVVGAGGPPGPQGPVGPQGEPGASTSVTIRDLVASTSEPPGYGQIALDSSGQQAVTRMWIHDQHPDTAYDAGLILGQLQAGSRVWLQGAFDDTRAQLYELTGAAVRKSGYHELPVAWVEQGAAPLAIPARVAVSLLFVSPGADLEYAGDWAAGSWQEGDIVVHGGIVYLCVRDTTSPPTVWPGS